LKYSSLTCPQCTPEGAQVGCVPKQLLQWLGWSAREAIQLNAEGIIQPAEIIEEANLGPAALQTAILLVGRPSNEAVAESGRPPLFAAKTYTGKTPLSSSNFHFPCIRGWKRLEVVWKFQQILHINRTKFSYGDEICLEVCYA
jgi:hypothetical protein